MAVVGKNPIAEGNFHGFLPVTVKALNSYTKSFTSGDRTKTKTPPNEITLGYTINKKSINTSVNPKMPYLSFLAINYDIPVINEVLTWFESCVIRSYANPTTPPQTLLAKCAGRKTETIFNRADSTQSIFHRRKKTSLISSFREAGG